MTRHIFMRTALMCLFAASFATTAYGQTFYTFTSGPTGDGFSWPASPTGLIDGDFFDTPDSVFIDNQTGNNVFFDSQYQVVGNGSRISGEALWGNPLDLGFGVISFDFGGTGSGAVQSLAFDFAWSEAGVPAVSDFLTFYVYDSEGRGTFGGWTLGDTFTGLGGGTGYEGNVSLDAGMFIDDDFNVDGGAFVDIQLIEIFLDELTFGGNHSEFALDNFATDGASGGGLDPANSDLSLGTSGIGTNRLRSPTPSDFTFGFVDVQNVGTGGTTYSVTLDPSSDPEFVVDSPATNASIAGGQTLTDGSGDIARIDTSILSGDYQASATLNNDLNALDPDEQVTYDITIFDPPSLTDDTASTVQVDVDPNIFIANAAAGPHAGARRASAEVTAQTVTGAGFSAAGLGLAVAVDAGETQNALVAFDRYGRLNGTYHGTLTVALKMTDPNRPFLNGALPVSDVVWNLAFDLATTSNDSVVLNTSDPLGPSVVGVNNATTAATLIDGQIASNQTVSMALTTDPGSPGSNADLAGTPVDLTFSSGNIDTYVLEFTYDDANIPVGLLESQLDVLFYDTVAGAWNAAVAGNSVGGSTFFNGSYADYLTALGGGVLDPTDLGAFGIDTVNNNAWAIIDHASVFGVGVLTTVIAGDLDGDGFVGIADLNIVLGSWNQNVPPANPLADPSGDGFVGIADLNVVLGNWNAGTPPSESSNIPEPGTLMVLGLMGMGLLKRGRSTC